jgi:hypothetical protein
MMQNMLKNLVAFAAIALATIFLLGCGGKNDNRQTGTTDPRILGAWVAREIHFAGQVQTCPGSITNGSTVSCTADTTTFSNDGHYTSGTTSDDFFFDGTALVLYNRAGNAVQFGVTFDASNNEMTWSFNQNGQPVSMIVDRVVL